MPDNETEPEILTSEVEQIIQTLKNEKVAGDDVICNEQIKYGGNLLVKKLTILYNDILNSQHILEDWKKSDIIYLLFKRSDRHKVENYRPITLSPIIAKIFSKIIEGRLRNKLNEQQPQEQAGFRKNYPTINHLDTINQLLQKANEYQLGVHLSFIYMYTIIKLSTHCST